MEPINIGFGNFVFANRIIAVISPDAAPAKRMVAEAKEHGTCIDASCGRKTKSILVMDSDHVVLSALPPEALAERMGVNRETFLHKWAEE